MNDFRELPVKSNPIGLRNNNPLNIRASKDKWQGMSGVYEGKTGKFVIFTSVEYGLRAWLKIYYTYVVKHKANTLAKFILRYAPPEDANNTEAYINFVSKETGISRDQLLTGKAEEVIKIMKHMIKVEIGDSYSSLITDEHIKKAFSMLNYSLDGFFIGFSQLLNGNRPSTSGTFKAILVVFGLGWLLFFKEKY